ncbi:MAG: hypothetical protein F4Y45_05470 [Acidobacteria bacterium]|nr:hypothetical protein [Acidobacteriota bacterium]MYJ04562.1 hypothetical protein [Acidobacteriota bacterium]
MRRAGRPSGSPSSAARRRDPAPVPDDLVRFSVGIDAAEDLIVDFEQAFDRLSA